MDTDIEITNMEICKQVADEMQTCDKVITNSSPLDLPLYIAQKIRSQ